MGLREEVNKRPGMMAGILIACIAIAIFSIFHASRKKQNLAIPKGMGYFTVDDGDHWFVDSLNNIPPFQHDGKEASRVYLFRDDKREVYVGYLEQFLPATKKKMDDLISGGADGRTAIISYGTAARRVKKPHGTWVNTTGPGIPLTITGPDGSAASENVSVEENVPSPP